MLLALLFACADKAIDLSSPEELAETCEDRAGELQTFTQTITFPARDEGCPWGEGDNLDRQDATFSARVEDVGSIDLPEGAVACDLGFDFAAVNGGEGTPMVYDDNFAFTFDDVLLATSYEPLTGFLAPRDDLGYTWDWAQVAGQPLSFDNDIESWCLGVEDGTSTCEIPAPETNGTMELDFDPSVASALGFVAFEAERFDFTFIAMGDNDDTDCSHLEFAFEVEVPYFEG